MSPPASASAHFALSYVLRYADVLSESATECKTALALDPGGKLFRSCAWVFIHLNQPQKAMEFVELDRGSEWAAWLITYISLSQGKLPEARDGVVRMSTNPIVGRELLQSCLDPQRHTALPAIAQKFEATTMAWPDPERRFTNGTVLAYCGEKESALRVLKSAVDHNYCAYVALQSSPLLATLRRDPQFGSLLSAAKGCQQNFLSKRAASSP